MPLLCRVNRSQVVWRTALADDPGAGGGKRHFQLHYSRGAQLYITGVCDCMTAQSSPVAGHCRHAHN
jgi:hypothetical protein